MYFTNPKNGKKLFNKYKGLPNDEVVFITTKYKNENKYFLYP